MADYGFGDALAFLCDVEVWLGDVIGYIGDAEADLKRGIGSASRVAGDAQHDLDRNYGSAKTKARGEKILKYKGRCGCKSIMR